MQPILTPAEMRAVDAAQSHRLDALIERAGAAVARTAIRMMGGTYGRVVNVVAGRGNNGADGRVAARLLEQRGVKVRMFTADGCPAVLPSAHLVIDAAYGTGFHGVWQAPEVGDALVLAVDVPSGIDALTGAVQGNVLPADRTLTFQALKPGLLLPPGSAYAGEIEVADIGLGDAVAAHAHAHLVQADDVAAWLPERALDAHKWNGALRMVAGSVGMTGAAVLAARGATRAGAGMVQLSGVGCLVVDAPVEVVQRPLQGAGWSRGVLDGLARFHALVIGPGIGRDENTATETRNVVLEAAVPVVVDGDALFAMAWNAQGAGALLCQRMLPTVLTPHDGEFALLTGTPPGADRVVAARRLAADTGAVVLLKGSVSVVANPDGRVLVVAAGDERLATAGTGDVLAGIVGALVAQGVDAFEAAAAGAWLHGRAAGTGHAHGFLAGDLPDLLPAVLAGLAGGA